jgi:hypothetical protein
MKISKILFFATPIVITAFLFWKTNEFFFEQSNEMRKYFKEKDSLIGLNVNSKKVDVAEAIQLKKQFNIIEKMKEPYIVTAKKYSSFNYSFSIFFTFFSILTGVIGFVIVKKGWDNVDNLYLKISFLISFFFSTFFGVLPKVLGNEENIKNNITKYNFYSGLQLDIYTLINDNKGYLKRNTPQSLDSLNLEILSITKNIKENQDLYFNVFIDRVPKEIKPFD